METNSELLAAIDEMRPMKSSISGVRDEIEHLWKENAILKADNEELAQRLKDALYLQSPEYQAKLDEISDTGSALSRASKHTVG